jgi:hypothetical protein
MIYIKMFNLTINSTNVANSLNNMYQYQFKNGAFEVPANTEMMITSFQIPYSWYNITSRYNNNSFKIYWTSPTVTSCSITSGGSGYTSVPTVAFTVTNTTVVSVTVTTGGSGYTSVPTVAFSGGRRTGATVIAVLTGTVVSSIVVTNVGTGYTSAPTVAFIGGGGTLAAGTAVLGTNATATSTISSSVSSIPVTVGGGVYTSIPTVTFTGGGGSGAATTASITNIVSSLTRTAGGTGYTRVPTVNITGGGGSGATATAAFAAGVVTTITVTAAGTNFTGTPTITFTGGGGTGSTVVANFTTSSVSTLFLTAGGSGYTSAPTVAITGGGGSGATGTATILGVVQSVTVTNGGSGYTNTPTIGFVGGGGVGATATDSISGSVTGITLTGGGTGYTVSSPTISFGGGGGTGVAATSSAYTPYTLTLDDGFYTVNALNARIQQFCIEKDMYLTDGSGNNVYYSSVSPNSTVYANQIITKLIPTSGTGYTVPSNFAGYPLTTSRPPYVEILSNNFGKYLGFTPGNYGKDQTADYNVLSNIIPTATTVNSLLVKCSLVNNGTSNQSDIIDSFTIGGSSGGTFGGNLNYTNNIEKWVRISEGRYNNFIVTIVDQNNNEISILDNNLLINFLIRVIYYFLV